MNGAVSLHTVSEVAENTTGNKSKEFQEKNIIFVQGEEQSRGTTKSIKNSATKYNILLYNSLC